MRKWGRFLTTVLAAAVIAAACTAAGETAGNESAQDPETMQEEQAVEEIREMIGITESVNPEGMNLEELTEAFANNEMGEYFDSASGFSMQYPSLFQFDEENGDGKAISEDGKAEMIIEHMENNGALTEDALLEAIRLETPDREPVKNEQNGCLRSDHPAEGGKRIRTDLYLLTEKSFHHITVIYPADEQEKYNSYIEYMINTMTTEDTDLG